METSRELHLFLIWNKAVHQAAEIIENMRSNFTVLRVFAVHWSDKHFSRNLSRFFCHKGPADPYREEHYGRGPFLAIVLADEEPDYGFRDTPRGSRLVNVKCFEAKEGYQAIPGVGHRIYATTTQSETEHGLRLLLHKAYDDFLATSSVAWNGEVEETKSDLLGADGWKDWTELLRTLNALPEYAVIRNFESLTNTSSAPPDIDLLCTSRSEIALLANAFALCPEPYRALYRVKVGGQDVPVHFRTVDEDYFDSNWANDMLARRVFSPEGFYHLSPEDYFHSLLYHLTVHKPAAESLYQQRLLTIRPSSSELNAESFLDRQKLRRILDGFFALNKYRFVEPQDLSVDFDSEVAGVRKPSPERLVDDAEDLGRTFQQLFEQFEDCSTNSPEFLKPSFRSGKSARFFSPNRAMFLEALQLPASSAVLEIGGKSGVLSRWLAERVKTVTVVEDDSQFVVAIQKRCKDLKSVRVLKAIDAGFKAYRTFDVAVAIMNEKVGVSDRPALGHAIRTAKQALKKNGCFVLAFDAVPNAVAVRDVVIQQLRSYGFGTMRFFYAFPNVILPRAVFTDEAIHASNKLYGYWASSVMDGSKSELSSLQIAGISSQGKLDDLATGCYIVATRDATAMPPIPWQVHEVSSDSRHPAFRVSTEVNDNGATLTVRKTGVPITAGVFEFQPVREFFLADGHTGTSALEYTIQNHNLTRFLNIFKTHANYLIRQYAFAGGNAYRPLIAESDTLLRGEALDAVLGNAVIGENSYAVFDLEFSASVPLPLSYVLYRSFNAFLQSWKPEAIWQAFKLEEYGMSRPTTPAELTKLFINSLGVVGQLKPGALSLLASFDARLQDFVQTGKVEPHGISLFERYHLAIALHARNEVEDSQRTISELQAIYPDIQAPIELVEEPVA